MQKDKPTEINSYGKFWKNADGEYHREDGPAIEYTDGSKVWYLNDNCHREEGPAVEYYNGTKEWYLHGELHREDGPAIEWSNGSKDWWINGKRLTQEEFEQNQQVFHCEICKAFQKRVHS